jgi:hypothetical protein
MFSKWFSESGKQVVRTFDRIYEIASDTNVFVVMLIGKLS